jgi:hypothetical protein
MGTKSSTKRSIFDSPATYEIHVQGALAADWSPRLEGMAIVMTAREDGMLTTVLTGELADQAALAGVLDRLYSLRLPVLSVSRLEINVS